MGINMKNFHEREFHPFLNYYLHKSLGIASKTIYQEKSENSLKGENEWVHPDLVGFSLPTTNWNEKVVNMCQQYNIPKVIMYSFELKKEVTMASFREDFFQAVSNSSWANEGYLVAAQIDTENEKLMQKINRLGGSFGIGIVHLNLKDPEKSEILVGAKRKNEIDGETVNHLFEINQDFKDFIKTVEDSLKINKIVRDKLDLIKTKKELEEILNKNQEEENEDETDNDSGSLMDFEKMNWNVSVQGKKPNKLLIEKDLINTPTWKDVYVTICNYLCKQNPKNFEKVIEMVKGKKRPYFTENENELRAAFYLEEPKVFAEVNLSANSMIKLIKEMLKICKMEENLFTIYLEK